MGASVRKTKEKLHGFLVYVFFSDVLFKYFWWQILGVMLFLIISCPYDVVRALGAKIDAFVEIGRVSRSRICKVSLLFFIFPSFLSPAAAASTIQTSKSMGW